MKNYNEMANDVLRRIGEHETLQRNRRKVMKKVIIPICCFCFVALLGLGLWQGDFLNITSQMGLGDSTSAGEKEQFEEKDGSVDNDEIDGDFSLNSEGTLPSNSINSASSKGSKTDDVIGMVKVNGVSYVQCSTTTKTYTPDKYLGEAYDFEGTYQTYLSDVAGGLYITKEDPNVLMVELKNSEYTDYVILIKEQEQSNKQG